MTCASVMGGVEAAASAGADAAGAGAGAGAGAPFAAAPLTAAPSRAFMRFATSCFPPNDISPSPTTSAGEYAPRLMLRGRAIMLLAKSETIMNNWECMVL